MDPVTGYDQKTWQPIIKRLAVACRHCGGVLMPLGEVTVSPEFAQVVIYAPPCKECGEEDARLYRHEERIKELEQDVADREAFIAWVREDVLRLGGDGYAEQVFWEQRRALREGA